MRKNIASVIVAFEAGKPHNEKTCRTDGVTIWSYDLPIARRVGNKVHICDRWDTRTTNGQITALKSHFSGAVIVAEIK